MLPERLISIQAIGEDVRDLALGNVVGSNTANVLLVLGVPALLAVMHTSQCNTRVSYQQMLAATILFIALAYRGVFDWVAGLILLACLAAMLTHAALAAKSHRASCAADGDLDDLEGADI